MTIDSVKEALRSHRRSILIVAGMVLLTGAVLVVTSPDTDAPASYPHGAVGTEIGPWGSQASSGERLYERRGGGYRLSEYDGGILYGPYWVTSDQQHPILGPLLAPLAGIVEGSEEGTIGDSVKSTVENLRGTTDEEDGFMQQGVQYYYHDGRVLDSNLNPVDGGVGETIERLHQLYVRTYLDPLLYAPTANPTPAPMTFGHDPSEVGDVRREGLFAFNYDRFEGLKELTKGCDLEYDLIPQDMFNAFDTVKQQTDRFFRYPSMFTAREMNDAQADAVLAYADYAGSIVEVMNTSLGDSDCFAQDASNEPISRQTLTEPPLGINSTVLFDHVRKATRNADRLQRTVERRESILTNGTSLTFSLPEIDVQNISHPAYDDLLEPDEAIEEFNNRREEEYRTLLQSNSTGNASGSPQLTPVQQAEARLAEELPRRYDIRDHCSLQDERVPVYGWDMDVYPNLVAGRRSLFHTNTSMQNIDHFSLCRCPYREISRLDWYAIDGLYEETSTEPVDDVGGGRVQVAEDVFMRAPGDASYDQLGSAYLHEVNRLMRADTFHEDLTTMWRRGMQARSKLHVLNETYDDFYNQDHMEVWTEYFPTATADRPMSPRRFNYFVLMESLYPLTFMTWSDQVWRLDERPRRFFELDEDQVSLTTYSP